MKLEVNVSNKQPDPILELPERPFVVYDTGNYYLFTESKDDSGRILQVGLRYGHIHHVFTETRLIEALNEDPYVFKIVKSKLEVEHD